MHLSERLSAVCAFVTKGNRVCDVGCDHGYLPIELVLRGHIPGALAMDVREGPLKAAQSNISLYGLKDRIETRLSDGLSAMEAGEADTIVISGMGGTLIRKILSDNPEKALPAKEWILEPQSDAGLVRSYLYENGVMIADEDMIKEQGSYYPIIRADLTRKFYCDKDDIRLYSEFGPMLLKHRHPLLEEYLKLKLFRLDSIMGLKPGPGPLRVKQLSSERALVVEALSRFFTEEG